MVTIWTLFTHRAHILTPSRLLVSGWIHAPLNTTLLSSPGKCCAIKTLHTLLWIFSPSLCNTRGREHDYKRCCVSRFHDTTTTTCRSKCDTVVFPDVCDEHTAPLLGLFWNIWGERPKRTIKRIKHWFCRWTKTRSVRLSCSVQTATMMKAEAGSLPEGKVKIQLEHDGTILDVDEDDVEKVRASPAADSISLILYDNCCRSHSTVFFL